MQSTKHPSAEGLMRIAFALTLAVALLVGAIAIHYFDVEIYHCGFDPHSLDMVIVREVGIAIFDSTSPH